MKPTWQEVAPLAQPVKSYLAQWDSIILVDGLLNRVVKSDDGSQQKLQLLVPRKRIPKVLRLLHDDVSGGHMGINMTLERVPIDIAGPFPVSGKGNKYILVAMDYITKWVAAYAISSRRYSKEFARYLKTGRPERLHSIRSLMEWSKG